MIEINLIPDVKREFLHAQKMRNTMVSFSILAGIGAVGLTAFVGLLLGGQLIHETIQRDTITKQFAKLSSVNGVSDLLTLQSQLESLPAINAKKSMSSRVFDVLVAITPGAPNEVTISKVALDPVTTTMTLEGQTVKGYPATDVFRKTILNTKVTYQANGTEETTPLTDDVVMGETSYGEDATGQRVLRFKLSFVYPPELLTSAGQSVRIISPVGQVDVTDSRTRVPDTLFSGQAKDIQEKN